MKGIRYKNIVWVDINTQKNKEISICESIDVTNANYMKMV